MEQIQEFETSLSALLDTYKKDPWSLLILQTLLWCFRRWAIHYLTSDEVTTTMREFLWESHIDLVDQFCPPDLREFAITWLHPEHVGDRSDVLVGLNELLLRIIDAFDHALQTDSDVEQDALADFLDYRMTRSMDSTFVGEYEQYRIYPMSGESLDSFSSLKVYRIMETILDAFVKKDGASDSIRKPEPELKSEPDPEAKQEPEPKTIAAALHRRRTRKLRTRLCIKTTRKNHKQK